MLELKFRIIIYIKKYIIIINKMAEKIVETHNLFIDTGCANKESLSRGDNFQLHLNTQAIDAAQGQFIRVSLNDFCMYKNFTDVNLNNFEFNVQEDVGLTKLGLSKKNYETIYDLATDFGTQLGNHIINIVGAVNAFTLTNQTPTSTTSIAGTGDNIIRFTLNTLNGTTPQAHGLTFFSVQFPEEQGECYELLGGNRLYGDASLIASSVNSIKTTMGIFSIDFECLYPAQRNTTSHIYLRTSLTSGAAETASLLQQTDIDTASEVQYSNILAKIPVNTEFCVYKANVDREFFVNLYQSHLNNIRFYITDEHSRPIGRRSNSSLKTATGLNTTDAIEQSTLGNLSFNAVLRIDVVQSYQPNEVKFNTPPIAVNPKSSGVLLNIKNMKM